jgi:hypothetical protein
VYTFIKRLSGDEGATWRQIFAGIIGASEYTWTVEQVGAIDAIFLVEVDSPEGVIRQSVSEPVVVASPASAQEGIETETRMLGVAPNPSQGSVNFHFSLGRDRDARLEIYDLTGRLVRSLSTGGSQPGVRTITWNGRDGTDNPAPSGIYRYVFQAGALRRSEPGADSINARGADPTGSRSADQPSTLRCSRMQNAPIRVGGSEAVSPVQPFAPGTPRPPPGA